MYLHSKCNAWTDLRAVLADEVDGFKLSRKVKGCKYYEIACAFDIETSSFYDHGNKRACMYVWQFGINGHVFMGRTWYEYKRFLNELCDILSLGDDLSLIVYVHNLAYEFQFMRKWFTWEKVFAVKSRTPVYARMDCGIEFRCSYLLSGYSLARLSDQLLRYKVKKLVGNLDYSLIRTSKTPLTDQEKAYCVNDVLVVMSYIQEKIESEGSIIKIPLTKTGYVRRICRSTCFTDPGDRKRSKIKRWRYNQIIKGLTIEPEEYSSLKWAFMGGFTHAGAFYSGCEVENVTSYDFTSSYPYVLVSEQYPMSKGERVTIRSNAEFLHNLNNYACMFDVDFYGLEETFIYDHYISLSRCYVTSGTVTDNGRIVSAEHARMTITEQDFFIIKRTYKWKECTIRNFYRYRKGYLPTDLVKTILRLYADKTQLKGVRGKEAEYLNSKEMLNSCYGMMVTDIVRPVNEYDDDWMPETLPDLEKELARYNSGFSRFMFYPWGVWCTAYARRNLWTGIFELGADYVYSDTDSIKGVNMDSHMDYIQKYNETARKKLEHACRFHGIDISETEPRTIKGVKKPLGIWDFDGHYDRFKTLGAKRYMVQDADKINITVSGLNKNIAVPFLCKGWNYSIPDRAENNNPFNTFKHGLYVPPEYTGKNTHTYIDDPIKGTVTDYQGHRAGYYEKTCVHMEPAEYSLSIAQDYLSFIQGLEDIEE